MNTEAIKTVAPTKRREWYRWARQIMARVSDGSNGFLLKALAVWAGGLAVAVAGFGVLKSIDNGDRLTRLEARAEVIERIDEGFARLERAITEALNERR